MASDALIDAIDWKAYEVSAGPAGGHVPVRIGNADVTEANRG